MINGLQVPKGFRLKPGMVKTKKNTHQYIKLDACSCGNNKFKHIKLNNSFECSRCKKIRGN